MLLPTEVATCFIDKFKLAHDCRQARLTSCKEAATSNNLQSGLPTVHVTMVTKQSLASAQLGPLKCPKFASIISNWARDAAWIEQRRHAITVGYKREGTSQLSRSQLKLLN